MIVRIIEKGKDTIGISDLIEDVKSSPRIAECGAIFSFEGIVRGKDNDQTTLEMDLTTPDIGETEDELKELVDEIKAKYGVAELDVVHYIGKFSPGDPLFLVVVAGGHRQETRDALREIIERVKFELDFKKEEHTEGGTNIIMSGG